MMQLEQLTELLEEKGYPAKLKTFPRRIYVGSLGSFYGVTIVQNDKTGALKVSYQPLILIIGSLLLIYSFIVSYGNDDMLSALIGITAASVIANFVKSRQKKQEIEAILRDFA
ncbi:hypothetical protein MGA5115_00047 [Marinomonas gallaica]|mgnify:CR=1 FL=1|uniref:Uncharacterized protein n=1 Tax=Marinomonas gallaica TaxID=1806667 RepID=A0A1C3JL68_9GAMM|nr:hypothetical protein [Marinomonas gallaica]SBT15973.1 hypothetical protein MGA5115_00047 [Marinomonas gallaica]SBT21021.1 hypothetical protein MGA5116_01608 [Marinomonas gallaica]